MKLIQGDCIEVMKTLEDNSVDTVITDPPYGLEFMGKEWDKLQCKQWRSDDREDWQDNHPESHIGNRMTKMPRYGKDISGIQEFHYRWALQALRVAKPGAFMFCFGGTRTFHRIACGIEDAGWEIRDTMMWLYGSGFPKSHNISKAIMKKVGDKGEVVGKATSWNTPESEESQVRLNVSPGEYDIIEPNSAEAKTWDGWGTALKPAFEPIIVAMKPRDGTFAENALKWGVAGLNIDGGRVHNKDVSEERTRHGGGKKWEGSNYNPDRKNVQPAGRFPANIIHDGSEEVLAGFPQSKSTAQPRNNQQETGKYGIYGKYKAVTTQGHSDSGSAARFFYCAKASKAERNAGLDGMEENEATVHLARGKCADCGKWRDSGQDKCVCGGQFEIDKNPTSKSANNHPTVKPLSLMEYLCKLTATPTGGTVLDPFMGSGTTGMACKKTGREFIGIELDEHYFEIAEKRIASVKQVELI